MRSKRDTRDFELEIFADVEDLFDLNLPSPVLLEYYRRLEKREILWNDVITDSTVDISMYILKWNAEDKGLPVEEREPIKIWVNSDGGCVNTVMHVIDIVKLSQTPVITIGMGKVYSSGGLLLMAGHKRYIFDNTCCLIHDGSTGAIGDTGKVIDNLEFTKENEVRMRDYILKQTSIPNDLLDKNYRRDWFMFSNDIIKYSIADKIVTNLDEIL